MDWNPNQFQTNREISYAKHVSRGNALTCEKRYCPFTSRRHCQMKNQIITNCLLEFWFHQIRLIQIQHNELVQHNQQLLLVIFVHFSENLFLLHLQLFLELIQDVRIGVFASMIHHQISLLKGQVLP